MSIQLFNEDCLSAMGRVSDNYVDSVVTDPPYELGFMGNPWDNSGISNNVSMWSECLRILKPGGYLLAFGGSRTYHRMACAIEDAGFEIRDQIQWIYGSGFPKSRNLDGDHKGWGTALKPAHEPIVVARKPLEGTVAANVQKWGTGALNIDGCRVEGVPEPTRFDPSKHNHEGYRMTATGAEVAANASPLGRWPANVIHDGSEEVTSLFPEQTSGAMTKQYEYKNTGFSLGAPSGSTRQIHDSNSGSAARFFYCAKTSKSERGEGNTHPTVKPVKLMEYLCRLVTPPGGKVLDPFMGSGSTGIASLSGGFSFIGIEKDPGYFAIAERRINIPQIVEGENGTQTA